MAKENKGFYILSSYKTFFPGSGTATIARFRVFACVHCEQSLYITRIYDETIRWQADTDVPGFIIIGGFQLLDLIIAELKSHLTR